MAGVVLLEGQVSDKAGTPVAATANLTLKERPRFVSRGGDKLDHALQTFGVDVSGRTALDVGASTGGFVDCLLKAGASRVIALDVGRGQLDGRLRNDERVFVLEKVNARYLEPEILPFAPEVLTMDVSFISVAKVLPAVMACMNPSCEGVILVKPQFEAGPKQVGRGGIVRDPAVHVEVLLYLARFVVSELDAEFLGVTDSGLPGTDGNVEYFFHIARGGAKGRGLDTLVALVDAAVARVMDPRTTGEA
jgi:23S rRNA (cytidine1920-2'-O)/16S rRNA (cytidine1409-2'-O)-methyltransferase